jgi:hypothetical protein
MMVYAVDVFEFREELERRVFTKYFNFDEWDRAFDYVLWYNETYAPFQLNPTYASGPYEL